MSEENCRRELALEIPAEEVSKTSDKIAKEISRVARVPGFRPGKAPISLIKRRFAADIRSEMLQQLLPNRVEAAVTEQKLTPVTQPQVEDVDYTEGGPLKFRATFEVLPNSSPRRTTISKLKLTPWKSLTLTSTKCSPKCASALPPSSPSKAAPSPMAITRN